MEVSYKLTLWFLMGIVKYYQSSQNSKFAMALQYLKKVWDEVEFLHANKHQSFLQVDFKTLGVKFPKFLTIIIKGHDQAFSKYSKCLQYCIIAKSLYSSLQYFYIISKKKSGMEFVFCIQIKIKFSSGCHYCFWWKWPDMSKVPQIESW